VGPRAGLESERLQEKILSPLPRIEPRSPCRPVSSHIQVQKVAANILNKQSRTAESGWSSILGVGRGATSRLVGHEL
jgi:hypothetical protein